MTVTDFRTRRAEQARQQELVNEAFAALGNTDAGREAVRQTLIAIAAGEHAAYPQYAGKWDDFTLATARGRIESKGGVQVEAGDVVLVRWDRPWAGCTPSHTFYSVRLGWDCACLYGLKPVEG